MRVYLQCLTNEFLFKSYDFPVAPGILLENVPLLLRIRRSTADCVRFAWKNDFSGPKSYIIPNGFWCRPISGLAHLLRIVYKTGSICVRIDPKPIAFYRHKPTISNRFSVVFWAYWTFRKVDVYKSGKNQGSAKLKKKTHLSTKRPGKFFRVTIADNNVTVQH